MLDELKEIYFELTGNSDAVITLKTKLNDSSLSLSSYGKVQLICAVEDHFGIEIPNDKIRSFKTVGDVIRYLKKHAR